MFTLQQIHDAHSLVKSWADFPVYIQALKQLGVLSYTIYVQDGHAVYQGENGYEIASWSEYETLEINPDYDSTGFLQSLKWHQQGQTDYMTFCQDAARCGVDHWIMDLQTMQCIYVDRNDIQVIIESIPQA